jgi:hypothetical protein
VAREGGQRERRATATTLTPPSPPPPVNSNFLKAMGAEFLGTLLFMVGKKQKEGR